MIQLIKTHLNTRCKQGLSHNGWCPSPHTTFSPFRVKLTSLTPTSARRPRWRFTRRGHERNEQVDLETDWQARVTIQFVPERQPSLDTSESMKTHCKDIHRHRYTPWEALHMCALSHAKEKSASLLDWLFVCFYWTQIFPKLMQFYWLNNGPFPPIRLSL